MTENEINREAIEHLTRELLGYVALVSADPAEQAGALVCAATTIVEREVGVPLAEAGMAALLEPTFAAWRVQTGRAAGNA